MPSDDTRPALNLARLADELSQDLVLRDAKKKLEEGKLTGLKEDIQLRKRYAKGFFVLLASLDAAVLILVAMVGLGYLKIEKDVLMALIGATVVQSGSITYFITKYLFSSGA